MPRPRSDTVDRSPARRWLALIIAFVTMCTVTLIGVVYWFKPISEADHAASPLLSPPLNLAIYAALSVLLYDWAVRRTKGFFATAFVIGASQYILVVDLTLRGERGIVTAGASAVLILATWLAVALVYRMFASVSSQSATPV